MIAEATVAAGPAVVPPHAVRMRRLGTVDYAPTVEAMRRFTEARDASTPDELWLLEHPPVYTVGVGGRPEHLPRGSSIPLERVDRGGQITYHGPGQAIVYTLVDLARRHLTVRSLVRLLEQAVIDVLDGRGITAGRRAGAPGVYADGRKIAALGLRVRRGCTYHGVALNVDMDLAPFRDIDPCGYPGLEVTRTADLGVDADATTLGALLAARILILLKEPR
jgi:lipoyl(octanoyl) transferase